MIQPSLSSLHKVFGRIEEIQGRFAPPHGISQEISRKQFSRELSEALGNTGTAGFPDQKKKTKKSLFSAPIKNNPLEKQKKKLLPLENRRQWNREIKAISQDFGLPKELVQAMMQVESGGNPQATSSKGAMGLMQLMPGTARLMGVKDPYDPEQSLRGGAAYMARMMKKYGNQKELALAAYNAGPGRVDACGGIPPFPETQNYVKKVLSLYHAFLEEGR